MTYGLSMGSQKWLNDTLITMDYLYYDYTGEKYEPIKYLPISN